MKMKLAIIAALPREVAGLIRGVSADDSLRQRGVSLYRLPNAVVVAAGMGAARSTLAVQAALATGSIGTLISAGLAGSCSGALLPGQVLEAALVIDERTGERFVAAGREGVVLVTTDNIASVREKSRLADSYQASLVDMEAATVARLAAAAALPFRAIKAVSDAHDFELAGLGRFAGKQGQFRTMAFALHQALRPWDWGRTVTLAGNSGRALHALTARLRDEIDSVS